MNFEMISPRELNESRKKNQIILIDLRDKKEFQRKHILNAINIPYEEIEENLYRLPKDQEIILYCERGGVSFMVAKQLSAQGFWVKTLIGGIQGYNVEKLE